MGIAHRYVRFQLVDLARSVFCVGLSLSAPAHALSIDFTTPTYFDRTNSTGLWNTAAGQAQTGVVVAASASKRLDFGDGSDGAFTDGPAQAGIAVSGNTITFNTTVKATYQFTSFNLSAGKTLTTVGSSPLTLLIFGNATIAGTIQSNGSVGTANQLSAGYPSGGAGGSGGGSGGQGGSIADANATTTAAAGTPASSPTRDSGKAAANSSTATLRAGGGGCHSAGATAATAGTNAAGTAGSCASSVTVVADTFDTTFLGGAGGGGGGARVATNVASGSGGGGGGGAIRLAALGTVTHSGAIFAQGGAGGANEAGDGTYCGGSGGGGAGGGIWIQTLGTFGGAGTVNISGGAGGTSVLCAGTTPGGVGSSGVYRADSPAGTQPWALTPGAAEVRTAAILAGQTYTVASRAIDLSRNYVVLGAAQETFRTTGTYCGATGSTSILYEGSRDGVTWVNPVAASAVSQLSDYPYIRFKITFDTTGGTPPCVTGLSIAVTYKDLADLTVRGGLFFCGSLAQDRPWTDQEKQSAAINGAVFLILIALGKLSAYRRPNGSRWRTFVERAHRRMSSRATS